MHKIQYHKTLNPKIWLPDNTMDATVSRAIAAVAVDFVEFLHAIGFPIDKTIIRDIVVYGSNANYFYDKSSDIDVYILADLTDAYEKFSGMDFFTLYKSLLHTWRRQFKLRIRGLGIDLSLENISTPKHALGWYKTGPAYSVIKNKWVHELTRLSPELITEYRHRAQQIACDILHQARAVSAKGGRLDEFVHLQQKLRDDAMRANYKQPLVPETMAYKMVRNTGLFEKFLINSSKRRADEQFNVK